MTEKNKYKRNGRQRQNGIKYNNNDIECNSSEQNKICQHQNKLLNEWQSGWSVS